MPLKDHKREIWCVQVIAGMIKEEAKRRHEIEEQIEMERIAKERHEALQQHIGCDFGEF